MLEVLSIIVTILVLYTLAEPKENDSDMHNHVCMHCSDSESFERSRDYSLRYKQGLKCHTKAAFKLPLLCVFM